MTTHAAIFFRDKLKMTARLVRSLDSVDVIHLFDNGSADRIEPHLGDKVPAPLMVHGSAGLTLTQMWNRSWDTAEYFGADNLAILNNDITVQPGFLAHLAAALRGADDLWAVSPDTRPGHQVGVNGHVQRVPGIGAGGMAGWAFMVKVEARKQGLRPIDEQFEWWYGDNDLYDSIIESGHTVGMVEGLLCAHEISATWRDHPELHRQAEIDGERYHGRRLHTP